MRRSWLFGVALLLALGGTGVYFAFRPVTVAVVHPETEVPIRIYGLGTVEARVLSHVGFEVGAALTKLLVDVGDDVKEGQKLAVLHPAEQEARVARAKSVVAANASGLAKAEAAVDRARAVLSERQAANVRQQTLVRRDVASAQRAEEAQRDEAVARADLAVAMADVDLIRAQGADAAASLQLEETLLSHHQLNAPYDAIVIARHVEAGTVVKAGDRILTLIDPTTVWIQAYIDEERAGQLALGQSATIRLRSRPDSEFHASLVRIGLESDRANEERRVWLDCIDCPQPMYLGEQAEVRITTGKRAQALMVPEVAISGFDGHKGKVWIVQNNRLGRATLTFGARDDRGRVEVRGGLPERAVIVAFPPKGASEGRPVRIGGTQ
jgi:HlyD family secretion protein